METLCPGLDFQVGDVLRIPMFNVESSSDIVSTLETIFTIHESHREASVEFQRPGPSPWRHAQAWAQRAVDREQGAPLPPYEPVLDPEPASDHLSFAVGVALGRFAPLGSDPLGVLDPSTADLSHALPHGILYLSATNADVPHEHARDSLGHAASKPILDAWTTHHAALSEKKPLREYLQEDFFAAVHKPMYENRPIYFPLSSQKKNSSRI